MFTRFTEVKLVYSVRTINYDFNITTLPFLYLSVYPICISLKINHEHDNVDRLLVKTKEASIRIFTSVATVDLDVVADLFLNIHCCSGGMMDMNFEGIFKLLLILAL